MLVNSFTKRLSLHVEEGPAGQTWLEFEALQEILRLDQSDLAAVFLEHGSDYRLVFDRVQRAGRVSHLASNLEKFDSSFQDLDLERVQGLAALRAPFLPFSWDLADGCIGTAWDVTNDTIVANTAILANLAVLIFELGEYLCVMVSDDDAGRVQSVHLMRQHEGALGVGVVGHNEPCVSLLLSVVALA